MKNQWASILFLIAFALSVAHSSIPHGHPVPPHEYKHSTKSHHHNENNDEHTKHGHDNSNHNSDHNLPVFSHFSNADYLLNSKYELFVKGKFIIECLEPVKISLQLPEGIDRKVPIPGARELPSSRFRSSQSLRAPPITS